jgi:NADH-quinone oxidoreductase subunit A
MASTDYLPFLYQLGLAAGVASLVVGASVFFGQRAKKNRIKDTAYECGVAGPGLVHARFSVKFCLTALLFVLFDIELIFLLPWTFVYREFLAHHLPILLPMLGFLGLVVLGLVYEVKKGALEWDK